MTIGYTLRMSLSFIPSAAQSTPEQPVFCAVITPHRSLGPGGYRLVMTLICLATVVSSVPFMILGAWPVAGFFGLDLLALWIAFRVNYRAAKSFEEVAVSRIEVMLRKVTARGRTTEYRFNPVWTRLERTEDEDYGLLALAITSRGQRVPIAQELSPAERAEFASAFASALAKARAGG
jgi:uncharacterized membrane protein